MHAALVRLGGLTKPISMFGENGTVRSCKYLNNIVEQDRRAIKRRCVSITIFGIELSHRIHKRQFSNGRER